MAIWAAVAVEFATAAAAVVDDLVDDEWNEQITTEARAINANSALIWLAHCSTARLADELDPRRAWLISDLLTQGYLDACAGEDLDLQLEVMPEASEEQAYEMTRRKSGSLVAMACQVGAAVATSDPRLLEAIGRFGRDIGIVAQLLNDLAGIDSTNSSRGSDIRRRKKTLPVVYALNCAREEGNETLLAWYQEGETPNAEAEQEIASMIHDLGGLHYGWVLANIHRREALRTLEALVQVTGRPEVQKLRHLVPDDRPRRG
jgi:geranylgeranyl pyrophosphate synthase